MQEVNRVVGQQNNGIVNSFRYELSSMRYKYTRTVYSILDLLRDIGGFFGAITPFFTFLVMLLQYRGSYFYILTDYMKSDVVSNGQKTNNKFQTTFWRVFKYNLMLTCPTCLIKRCKCIRMNREQRIIAQKYLKLEKEIHVSSILKNLRALQNFTKQKFTKDGWQ